MTARPPPPDILLDARQEAVHVGDHCSGERWVVYVPDHGEIVPHTHYAECDRKATCARYMDPKVVKAKGPTMRMPEEKPCPCWKEWKHGNT